MAKPSCGNTRRLSWSQGWCDINIRKVTLADADWLHEVAEHAYPAGTYDRDDAERWMTAIIASDDHLVLRGDNAFRIE